MMLMGCRSAGKDCGRWFAEVCWGLQLRVVREAVVYEGIVPPLGVTIPAVMSREGCVLHVLLRTMLLYPMIGSLECRRGEGTALTPPELTQMGEGDTVS
jgi:hypothetical protein